MTDPIVLRIGAVADMFGVSTQTIRNWINQEDLHNLFSVSATPPPGKQAEFTENDVLILNTINGQAARGNHNWKQIGQMIREGYREASLPERAAIVAMDSHAGAQLIAKLAALTEREAGNARVITMLEERVEELKDRLERSDGERESYMRKLVEAEVELRLYRSGRLKSSEG